jgi:hypothetical protein
MAAIASVGAAPAATAPAATAPAATASAPGAGATRRSFGDLLRSQLAPRPGSSGPSPSAGGEAVLLAVERAQQRLDAILAAARSGRTFTAQELLVLQAEAYRTAQTVDLAARLVEQGAQSVKQALNTQL